jgi:hypothetical protein
MKKEVPTKSNTGAGASPVGHSQIALPNVTAANAFLAALDPKGTFTFQTFDDQKERKDKRLARILHGTLAQHLAVLTSLQQRGAGVFVMVNEGDGKGRSAKNVIRVRSHFLDLDGSPLAPVLAADLQPHIVVESSPGKWHAYYVVEDCPLDHFKARQQALAQAFGGDMAVCDLPRVMRLPGFWHLKATPFQTRLVKPTI